MARGWESKSIEAQQDEAARGKTPALPLSDAERLAAGQRRTLELSRARAADDLSRATSPHHRRMLEQALEAIDREIDSLPQPRRTT